MLLDVHKQQAKRRRLLGNKRPSVPHRMVFIANFRLITGRDYHQRHLNRIGLKDPRCAHCAATPKTLTTSKDIRVWQMPWTMAATRIDVEIIKIMLGCGRESETHHLKLVYDKNVCVLLFYESSSAMRSARWSGKWLWPTDHSRRKPVPDKPAGASKLFPSRRRRPAWVVSTCLKHSYRRLDIGICAAVRSLGCVMNARTGMNRHIVSDKTQHPGQVEQAYSVW
jgi:hypothetical protein